ncbi:hypothetical protein ACN469_31035 [Corallococcus terminator]
MRLVVTGMGMLTSLGYGATGTCAAIRAGLSRAQELDSVGPGGEPLVGHPVTDYAEGFLQAGAWLRLGAGALADLLHSACLPLASDNFWLQTGLTVLAPRIDPERFLGWMSGTREELLRDFALPLSGLVELPFAEERAEALGLGHCGLGEAMKRVGKEIESGRLARAIILGADSYLDPMSLDWLAGNRRLKHAEQPVGVLPGEAAVCILVESPVAARARNAFIGACVEGVVVGHIPERPLGKREQTAPDTWVAPSAPRSGRALAECVEQLLSHAKKPFAGHLIADLNGETWKSTSWGHAQVLLNPHVDFDRCRLTIPAECLGEIGAASGPLGVGLAVSDFVRGGASSEQAIICSLSDAGQVSAVLLRSPEADSKR